MLSERLALLVSLDANQAVKGFENVGKTADKNLTKTDKGFQRVGTQMQRAGVGMASLGLVAIAGLGKAAMASEEAEASTRKLENSIKNSATLAGHSVDEFTDLAKAIQSKTAADADNITAGLAVLAQGKLQADQIKELTPLVVDLARKKGIDEVTAFTMASKAVAGSTGALKKAGIQVDENLAKTDAYSATIEALRGSVGGFAEEEGKTFAGSLSRLKNQLGDIQEGVGKGAVDAFTEMLKPVSALSDKFSELDPKTQSMIGHVATFGATGLVAAGGIATMVGKLITMRETLGPLAGTIGKGTAAVAGLAFAVDLYIQTMNDAREAGSHAADGLKDLFTNADPATVTMEQLNREMQNLQDQIVSTDDAVRGSQAPWDADHRAQMKAAVKSGRDVLDSWAQLKYAAQDLAAEQKISEDAALRQILANDELATSVMGASEAFDAEAVSIEAAVQQLKDYDDALHAQFDPQFAVLDALHKEQEARVHLAEVMKNGNSTTRDVQQAQEDLTKAVLDTDSASLRMAESMLENGDTMDDVRGRLDQWVTQGRITRDTADQIAGKLDLARRKGEGYAKNYEATASLRDNATAVIDALSGRLQALASNPFHFLITASGSVQGAEHHAAGGLVGGQSGVDRVPMMATRGEYVMQTSAVDALGLPTMQAINQGRLPAVPVAGGERVPSHLTLVVDGQQFAARIVADGMATGARRGVG